ncbi:hypothetical protein [Pseudomonas sp. RIT-To-2]|uniref:hypothetical protein n=1 Tax=Pseudomonas sp. RIT-To-2 TaxID=3462541 RepID=UPI002412F9A7
MSKTSKHPHDMLYVHSDGTKAKIVFLWRKQHDLIPKGLDITIKFPSRKHHHLKIQCDHTVYQSLSQARRQGMIIAEGIVDLLAEPLV